MRYRKKPIVIEAFKWTGGSDQTEDPAWVVEAIDRGFVYSEPVSHVKFNTVLRINTLEGVMEAQPGDYIIKGIKGEIYPCKPDIFEATYEAVDDEHDENQGKLEL
jgi:hypothetical protein